MPPGRFRTTKRTTPKRKKRERPKRCYVCMNVAPTVGIEFRRRNLVLSRWGTIAVRYDTETIYACKWHVQQAERLYDEAHIAARDVPPEAWL